MRTFFFAALLSATLWVSPSRAQSGFILEPTHTLTAAAGVDTQFTAGAWTPSAPTTGGPGTVLRLDVDTYTGTGPSIANIENDFTPMVYDLSGLVLNYNDRFLSNRISSLLRPAGASWRFVSSGGLDPRIERLNSGIWEFAAPMEFANDVTYFSSFRPSGLFIEGPITGAGGLIVDGTLQDYRVGNVGSTLKLNAQASYTGPTIIRARGLDILDAGSLTATSSITVEPAGRLTFLVGSNFSGNRIGDTIPVTLAGGALTGNGFTATSYTENIGDVTLARATSSQIGIRPYRGELALSSLTRQRHATLSVYGESPIRGVGGVVNEGEINAGGALPLVGGAGAAGTTSISIVPYMAGHSTQDANPIFAEPNSLVTLDPNNNFRVLDRSTELQANLIPDTLTNANVLHTSDAVLTAPTSVNALVFNIFSSEIVGPGSLSITSGAFVSSDSDNIIASISVKDLLFPNDAYVWASARVEIFSDVTVTGDFNKSGLGLLELFGPTTASGGAAFTQGKTDLYGSLDVTDHVIVGGDGELEMFAGASLTTPVLEIAGDKARFTMSGGDLQAGAVIGNLFLEGGTLSPAAALETSIDGDLTLFSGSELAIEIDGTGAGQFDQIDVSGDLIIVGDLELNVSSYTPTLGDEILFARADGAVTGKFAGLDEGAVAANVAGLDLVISYTAGDGDDIGLLAVSGLSGDYNNDGAVDAADYAMWRNNLGAAEGTLLNDAVGGAIDADQYVAWKNNFGAALSAAVSNTIVPEPSTYALLSLLAITWMLRYRITP